MSSKIVYGIHVNGAEVLVEAANRPQAIRTATAPLVGTIRVLTGGEVSQACRAGKNILVAGAVPADEAEEQQEEQQQEEQQQDSSLGGDGLGGGDGKN